MFPLRHGVVAVLFAIGVAFTDAFCAHPDAFQHAPFPDGFDGVLGAGRRKTAVRPQHRREEDLIKSNGKDEKLTNYIFHTYLLPTLVLLTSDSLIQTY